MSSVTTIETIQQSPSPTPSLLPDKVLPLPPKRRFWHTSWIWETLSLLLSISCITAVLILLLFYNNKPIPTWRFLTLNTAISILAVVAKSALLVPVAEVISQQKWYWFWDEDKPRPLIDFQRYDAASRGPWGSFVLLLRPRTWHLVSVGALVTVLALGMEPALQQVQTYTVRTVESPAKASLPRVTNYTDLGQDGTEFAMPILGTSTRGAVYSGLYSSPSTAGDDNSRDSATCPTGNCTWPAYSSLEVCSGCQNLTMQLQNMTEKSKYLLGWELNGTNHIDSTTNAMVMSSFEESQFAYRAMNVSLILDTVTVFFPPGSLSRNIRPHAYECILYYCIKTYSKEMINGSMAHIDSTSWPNTASPPRLADLNKTGAAYIDPDLVQNYGVQQQWYHDKYWTLRPPPRHSNSGEKFFVNLLTFFYLRTWLQKLVTGDISTDPDIAAAADDLTQNFYQQMTGTQHNYVWAQASRPSYMPGPAPLFERLASAMTAYMLSQSADKAFGSSYATETYVRVRWGWAILPVMLALLTAILLVATAALSVKRDVPTWKSSALPSLFHGLEECQTAGLGACRPERIGVMETRAGTVRASLCSEEGIVRLRPRSKVCI